MKNVLLLISLFVICNLTYGQQKETAPNEILVEKLIKEKDIDRNRALKIAQTIQDTADEINNVYNDSTLTDNVKRDKIDKLYLLRFDKINHIVPGIFRREEIVPNRKQLR
ncbi:hypothetical protein FXV77_10645 [Sphingobacterium phlebotomi]|uniref:Uncharacterized protein n=1 Tax=Sphingobacterium phlebotomi TaxID=2605433 RepID=A0A5D4H6G3_9SPHI|nr:hypothetical protein [Sphingobacterium phlebotomi]TYR36356.1 hypothetical protein FXV77_10645 [Sphingobacterium phlebotomi]